MTDNATSVPRWSRFACWVLGTYAMIGGVLSLLGWVLDLPRLTDWYNNGISIQPNAAVAALSAGGAVLFLTLGSRRIAAGLGALVAFIGSSVIFQHFSGIDLGFDALLMFDRTWGRVGVLAPGRMGPPGATAWTLIGVSLFIASLPGFFGNRCRFLVLALSQATASIASLSLIGYLYGASVLYTIPTLTIIALQTASFIFAVSLALIISVPELGLMRLLNEDNSAGILTRRIAPALIVLPVLIGFIRLLGERADLYDGPFGTALRTLVEIVLFLIFLWSTGRVISRHAARHKKDDQALRQQAAEVQTLLDTLPVGVLVAHDRECRQISGNHAAHELLRTPLSSNLSRTGQLSEAQMFFRICRNGTEIPRDELPVRRAARGEEIRNEEVDHVFDDGRVVHSLVSATPLFDDEGRARGAIASVQDISARKQSEDRAADDLQAMTTLRELGARSMQAGVSIDEILGEFLEAAIAITHADKGNVQLFEAESEELKIVIHRGFEQPFLEYFAWIRDEGSACGEAMASRRQIVVDDVEQSPVFAGMPSLKVLLDAGLRAVQSTPVISSTDHLLGIISTHWSKPHKPSERDLRLLDILARQAADFLERRSLESQREALLKREQDARQAAEKANSLKDEFLATLSHELRNPLNVILGYSELLLRASEKSEPQTLREMSEVLTRNAKAQSQLVNDLLDLSRLQTGKLSLNQQTVPLAAIVINAVESVQGEATAKRISLSVKVPTEPLFVKGDPLRLEQIVWNLLNNAVKFTPPGGQVNVSLSVEEQVAILVVEDNGHGIPQEFLPHIFEMFRQADSSSTRRQGGLGIGLALVKQLVQLQDGEVTADSNGLGKGARFSIRLPICAGERLAPHVQEEVGSSWLNEMRVLVIDDSQDTTEMLRFFLESNRAIVRTANNGVQALQIINEDHFDVILSDVSMPEMDGFEFLRLLRATPLYQDVPVFALTGNGRAEDIERAKLAGFASHIVKPVELGLLLDLLQRMPRRLRLRSAPSI